MSLGERGECTERLYWLHLRRERVNGDSKALRRKAAANNHSNGNSSSKGYIFGEFQHRDRQDMYV